MKMNHIIHGDCLEELKKLPDDSVDLLCTDPPYGYSFMGKDWDKAVPSVEIWKECLRVLKPGAFAFIMSAPRQDVLSQMIVRIGEAGFDTNYTSIYWTYASGFPKAMNIGKMVDKRNGTSREVVGVNPSSRPHSKKASAGGFDSHKGKPESAGTQMLTKGSSPLEGSYGGFQPKPAVEVVIVAMKPLSEKTYVDQALKNGKGITWLDDCRVPHAGIADQASATPQGKVIRKNFAPGMGLKGEETNRPDTSGGRFPANLIVSDDVLNDGRVTKSGVKDLSRSYNTTSQNDYGEREAAPGTCYADNGSYSRYFDLDAWAKTLPFLICPKASKGEKNEGLEDWEEKYSPTMSGGIGVKDARDVRKKNVHPTVKPLKLMSYLITLGSRPGDTVLEPFAGSFTTAIAAKQLGRNFIAIERDPEYVAIGRARLSAWRCSMSIIREVKLKAAERVASVAGLLPKANG